MKNWLKEQFNWLKSFLNEKDSEKGSFKRLASLIMVSVFVRGYLKVSVAKGQLQDIPEVWAMFLGAIILGLGFLDKWKGKKDV